VPPITLPVTTTDPLDAVKMPAELAAAPPVMVVVVMFVCPAPGLENPATPAVAEPVMFPVTVEVPPEDTLVTHMLNPATTLQTIVTESGRVNPPPFVPVPPPNVPSVDIVAHVKPTLQLMAVFAFAIKISDADRLAQVKNTPDPTVGREYHIFRPLMLELLD
jgi:hypothetical protein